MKDLQKNVTAVYEILSDVYPVSPWSEKQILSDMQQENVDYFFIEKNGEIAGFLAIQQLAGELEITNIAIKKAYQGHR